MTPPRFPPRLPDIRSAIANGDITGAIWLMVNSHQPWVQWLNAGELTKVRAHGCPDWVLGETNDETHTIVSSGR